MRIKVGTEKFPKEFYFIGRKAFWLSMRAFVETCLHLNEISGKIMDAKVEGLDSVYLTGKEASSLVIYLFHIKERENDPELLQVFEALKEEALDKKEKIVKILPENLPAYLRKKGIEMKESRVKSLVEKTLKAIRERHRELNPETEIIGEMLLYSFKVNQEKNLSERAQVVVDDVMRRIKAIYEKNKDDKEKVKKELKRIEESVAYSSFASSYTLGELLKSGDEVFVLKDKNDFEVNRLSGLLSELTLKLESTYDPNFKWSLEKMLSVNKKAKEAVEAGKVKEYLKALEKELSLSYYFVKEYNQVAGTELTARDLAENGIKVPFEPTTPEEAEKTAKELAVKEWENNLPSIVEEKEVEKELSDLDLEI